MRPARYALLLACSATLISACGGAAGSDLFAGGGGSTFDTPDAGGPATPDATTPGAKDAGVTPVKDASVPTIKEAGADAAVIKKDAGMRDASTGGSDASVACAMATCAVPGETCCRTSKPIETFACTAGATCPVGDMAIPCDDANDCEVAGKPNTVCCGQGAIDGLSQEFKIISVQCRSPGNCNAQDRRILCDDTVSNACPNSLKCTASTELPGYKLCLP